MKKLISLSLAVLMSLSLAACGSKPAPSESAPSSEPAPSSSAVSETPEVPETTGETVNIAMLKGPTAIGAIKLMEDAEKGETRNTYNFSLAGAPDELVGKIVKGELDIAAVPTNLGAVLYQKTMDKDTRESRVQVAALNTLGVLYMLENGDTIHSMEDLKGKTVCTIGKGATPEYVLNYLLTANGLEEGKDVTVEYKSEAAEAAGLLAEGKVDVAMLPQPFVTTVLAKNENTRVALDMTAEWDKVAEDSVLTTGCVIVQKKFAQEHPEAMAAFMEEYAASVAYVTDPANIDDAAALTEKFGIIPKAPVAKKAIPACNITFIDGEEMKTKAGGFLKVLFDANPASVGGNLPNDDFYYQAAK